MVNIRDIETYRENNQLEAKKAAGGLPGSAALLSEGTSQVWESGRNALSPAYTTKWTDLPEAR